jgi:hypothetical protein
MSYENINEDLRPIRTEGLLEQTLQEAIEERLFQEAESIRLREELDTLRNMIRNNVYIPFIADNNILSRGPNSQHITS